MESPSLPFELARRAAGAWELPAPLRGLLDAAGRLARRRLLGLLVPVLLAGAWALAARLELVSPQLLVPPEVLLETFWSMLESGELRDHMQTSLLRVAAGFAVGATAGFVLGAWMGLSPRVRPYLKPAFDAARQVPLVGWLPLLVLWLGIDEAFKIVFISVGAFVPMAVKTLEGIEGVPAAYREVGRVLGCGRLKVLRRVILPAALPAILTGLRLSLSEAWMLVIAAELVASTEGIGYVMTFARTLFQTDVVLVGILAIAATGFLMDRAFVLAQARLLRWRRTFNA
jgi:sulfonate transport system permease protein